jgi:ribosome maturation factor RimP
MEKESIQSDTHTDGIKSGPKGLEKRFVELCEQVLPDLGLKLYDLEYNPHNGNLRIFIVKEETGTAQLEDCVRLDRALDPFIESESWIPEKLNLEVSSPGIYRHLSALWHFEKVVGQSIHLTLRDSLDKVIQELPKPLKSNKKFKAKLLEAGPETLVLDYRGVQLRVPMSTVKRANLEIEE